MTTTFQWQRECKLNLFITSRCKSTSPVHLCTRHGGLLTVAPWPNISPYIGETTIRDREDLRQRGHVVIDWTHWFVRSSRVARVRSVKLEAEIGNIWEIYKEICQVDRFNVSIESSSTWRLMHLNGLHQAKSTWIDVNSMTFSLFLDGRYSADLVLQTFPVNNGIQVSTITWLYVFYIGLHLNLASILSLNQQVLHKTSSLEFKKIWISGCHWISPQFISLEQQQKMITFNRKPNKKGPASKGHLSNIPLVGALAPLQISRFVRSRWAKKLCGRWLIQAKQKLFEDDKHIIIHDFICN